MTNSISTEFLGDIRANSAAGRKVELPDGSVGVIVPSDMRMSREEPRWPKLERIQQKPTFYDVGSFCAYVNVFKGEGVRLFAMPSYLGARPHVTAIFDYHRPGSPDHSAHAATLHLRHSEEWQTWTAAETFSQADFAEFIEERRRDITNPTAAELLDMVRQFKASRKVEFDSVLVQDNGDIRVTYDENTEAKGKAAGVAVPAEMKLGIPVYFQGERFEVPVFLRYRLGTGKVSFAIKLDRPDYVENAAFECVLSEIAEATELTAHIGQP
jgi:uncharacterized protein YfdQ (DUF2303 family)